MRRLVRALAILAALLFAFLIFLWFRAGRDLAYMLRVLGHRDSSTSDYRWKDAMGVAPAPAPRPWPSRDGCGPVAAALARDPDAGAMDDYLTRGGALALVVIRDGALTCEWYGNGGARDRPAAAFSISKTVVSLLLARAVATGALALDEPITTRVPELAARDPRFAAIRLADLVDMRSGIGFEEDAGFPWVDQDAPAVYYASDLVATVLARAAIEAAPGPFVYNDYAPNLIGLALARATRAPLPAATQALWDELGAENPAAWSVDDRGFAWHESGFVVTARDLARVGQLVLDGGRVGDRQVAPPAFVARSLDPAGRTRATTFAGTDVGYRNGWWTVDGDLVAMGRWGQIMLVSPATRTVIVRLGEDGHAETNIAIARRLQRVARRLAGRD
ncbi:MAG: beta-lactamase family protein [Deltaproteobacteria bacterium]|nr:beta-lactamase family protein [Deltaproteobacteria bacterium]